MINATNATVYSPYLSNVLQALMYVPGAIREWRLMQLNSHILILLLLLLERDGNWVTIMNCV